MQVLLAAATNLEVRHSIEALEKRGGVGEKFSIEWLITGVGSMAATWALTRQIDRRRPDLIIQAGIAGSFAGMRSGEVVAIREDQLAGEGVWEDGRFKTLFDLKLAAPDAFPYANGRLINPYSKLLDLTHLEVVGAITVSEITTDPQRIEMLKQNTGAAVESMEGAALHYACLQAGVPFLQLRSVSNEVGVRDKTKWDINSAVAALNRQLLSLLDALTATSEQIF